MEITFREWIDNPMGKGNAVLTGREMYKEKYTTTLDKILVREAGNVKYTLYKDSNNFYAHIKVPSENVKDFYYDVVIMFYTKDSSIKASASLQDYNVNFFSNDPFYSYTYAFAMVKNKLIIKDLVPRMDKYAIKHESKARNPKNELGYIKSIYFAYLIMKKNNLLVKNKYLSSAKPYDKKLLLKEVMQTEDKVKLRKDATTKKAEANKKLKEKNASTRKDINTLKNSALSTTPVAKKSGTRKSMYAKKAKKAKRI